MPDYTAFSKIFKAANNAPSAGGALPPIPDKPKIAGYLPAPHEARFISSAEEAAKKLPPYVKAESMKNELLKRGAKPVELEYADIDGLAERQAGHRIPADYIQEVIQKDGPLGQITRVEQHPTSEAMKAGLPRQDIAAIRSNGPFAADVRSTFDAQTAYPDTVYPSYTEQGKRGDHSGYREVLYNDPQNIRGRWPGIMHGQPINAHDSDYWVRYHNNPDSIAVQNIQSDVGQKWTKQQAAKKKREDSPYDPPTLTGEMLAEHGPVPTPEEWQRAEDRFNDLVDRYGEPPDEDAPTFWPADARQEYEQLADVLSHPALTDENGFFHRPETPQPVSPLAKDDNWKNFIARQVILEAAKEGKPISLPTGANAHAVEMMPENAAKHFYEKDMPERIRKIIKGFDPKEGARVEVVGPAQEAADARRESSILWSNELHNDDVDELRKTINQAFEAGHKVALNTSQRGWNNSSVNALNALNRLNDSLDDGWNYQSPQSISDPANTFGTWASDENLPPEIASQMQKVMSHLHLAHSRGKFYVPAERADPAAARREGTWIHMSPVARREILEKGMPIMSIGAGALLSGLNDQSNDR
jgi:hypothetical protein